MAADFRQHCPALRPDVSRSIISCGGSKTVAETVAMASIPTTAGSSGQSVAPAVPGALPVAKVRLEDIDALRGVVMVLMLLDHLRETWFQQYKVTDPIDAATILPAIGFARFAVSFCAPIFVALTGLGVYLFSVRHTRAETTSYLLKRGLL